jgi:hypothetical protein
MPRCAFDWFWSLGADYETLQPVAFLVWLPPLAKVIAAVSLCLWVGVMYFGRMLPYLGNAF